jgi:lysozyme
MPTFTPAAKQLLKRLEGCRLEAYNDRSDGSGDWTIGWGHIGPEVFKGVKWTQAQADAQLDKDIARFVTGVTHMTMGVAGLSDAQFSALVLFAFNEGLHALLGSMLLHKIRAGDFRSVPEQLARWKFDHDANGNPVVDPILVNRRKAETALWQSDNGGTHIA